MSIISCRLSISTIYSTSTRTSIALMFTFTWRRSLCHAILIGTLSQAQNWMRDRARQCYYYCVIVIKQKLNRIDKNRFFLYIYWAIQPVQLNLGDEFGSLDLFPILVLSWIVLSFVIYVCRMNYIYYIIGTLVIVFSPLPLPNSYGTWQLGGKCEYLPSGGTKSWHRR